MKRLCMLLAACAILAAGPAWAESITVCSYGGTLNKAMQEAFGKPFTEATGVEVVYVAFPTYAQILAQVKSGNIEWDVVDTESRMYARGIKDDVFETIDVSRIPAGDFVEGSVSQYGMGLNYYSYNVAYRTDVWPEGTGPHSWKDVWDVKKFPGPRGMKFTAYSNLEAALMADGVAPSDVYPIDIDRAFKKLSELKPDIRVFWKNGGNAQEVMRAHEADTGSFTAGRMLQIADQGVPVVVDWNQQIVDFDYYTILKGTKHKKAAMDYLVFASDPKRQAVFAKITNYGPANKKAYEHIDTATAKRLPTYEENLKTAVMIDASWYAEHEAEIERKWEAWKIQ